jgi:hypothetical protein
VARFPEQRLWDRIRRNLGREIHIERIENAVAAGTPDTLVLYKGQVTFVEHKTAKLPMRVTSRLQWRHELTPQQRNWHRVWFQRGGRSYIVVGIGMALYCVPGRCADEVNDYTESGIDEWVITMAELGAIYRGAGR